MRHVLLSVGLGLLTPIVYILGAEPFETPGQNPPAEILSGSVAVILYFTVSDFLLVRATRRASSVSWPIPATLLLSLLAPCLLVILLEGGRSWLYSALPMFVSGCLGVAIATLLPGRRPVPPPTPSLPE